MPRSFTNWHNHRRPDPKLFNTPAEPLGSLGDSGGLDDVDLQAFVDMISNDSGFMTDAPEFAPAPVSDGVDLSAISARLATTLGAGHLAGVRDLRRVR